MKKGMVCLLISICLTVMLHAQDAPSSEDVVLESENQKLSYAFGVDVGKSMKRLNIDIDFPVLVRGMKDAFDDASLLLTPEEITAIKKDFFLKRQKEMNERMKVLGEKNLKESEEFLTKNKEKEGIVVTDSGLQYEIITQGDGPKPTGDSKVKVHYKGMLLDGTEFDSSYNRGEPATFHVKRVIPGWSEGVQLMNVGSKYRLYIPPAIGYGKTGAGNRIPPNATLLFEVELLEIVE
ncbi:FKBP-type peptidyl-prolyl cis-trans isomerase [Chlamydiota bacterium]